MRSRMRPRVSGMALAAVLALLPALMPLNAAAAEAWITGAGNFTVGKEFSSSRPCGADGRASVQGAPDRYGAVWSYSVSAFEMCGTIGPDSGEDVVDTALGAACGVVEGPTWHNYGRGQGRYASPLTGAVLALTNVHFAPSASHMIWRGDYVNATSGESGTFVLTVGGWIQPSCALDPEGYNNQPSNNWTIHGVYSFVPDPLSLT